MKQNKIYGYKAFLRDEKGLYSQPNENEVRFYVGEDGILEREGKLVINKNGIHFCRKPSFAKIWYDASPFTEVWKIEILGKVLDDESNGLSFTNKLKLVKKLNSKEYDHLFGVDLFGNWRSKFSDNESNSGVYCSTYINASSDVNGSIFLNGSHYVRESGHIAETNKVYKSDFIQQSDGVNRSSFVNKGKNVLESKHVYSSNNVRLSDCVYFSNFIRACSFIEDSIGLRNCNHLRYSFFCSDINYGENMFFNKKIKDKKRLKSIKKVSESVMESFVSFFDTIPDIEILRPDFYSVYLRDPNTFGKWNPLPDKVIEKLTSFKEFDGKLFKNITGIDVNKLRK